MAEAAERGTALWRSLLVDDLSPIGSLLQGFLFGKNGFSETCILLVHDLDRAERKRPKR